MMEHPHSENAEKAIVSCLLWGADKIAPVLAEKGVTSQKFHLPNTSILFDICMSMWAEGKKIDLITVTDEANRLGKLQQIGGAFAITEICDASPSLANVGQYIDSVESDWKRRELSRISKECIAASGAREKDPIHVASLLIESASNLSLGSTHVVLSAKDLAMSTIDRCMEAIENKGKPKGVISTGFTEFDALLNGGIRKKDFILVTAPTKGGKTIMADAIVEACSVEQGLPSIVFTLEMSPEEKADRMIASIGRVSATSMKMGWLNEGDLHRLQTAAVRFAASKVVIRNDLNSLAQIVGAIRQEKMRTPNLQLAVIDYLQLIDEPPMRGELREQVVARISTTLRRLASQLDIAIVFLSQENDDGRARESRRLEQDCTTWLQIEPDKDDDSVKIAKVRLNRNGPPGVFKLAHRKACLRFEDYAEEP